MNTTTELLTTEAEKRLLSVSKRLKVRDGQLVQDKGFKQLVADYSALEAVLKQAKANIRATMEQYNVKRVNIDEHGYIGFIPCTTLLDTGATNHWLKKSVDTEKVKGYLAQHGNYPKGIVPKVTERFKVAVK